jgi:hydrogenase maturation protein HypF
MLDKRINSPVTSSAGRLFDAVAALVGLRQRSSFESQAAMELEFAADPDLREAYPSYLVGEGPMVIDWEPTIKAVVSDIKSGVSRRVVSAKFHNMLAQAIVGVAQKIGQPKVVLTGGCFQNRLLLERVIERLNEANFRPIWHQRIPPNDGGISLGQAVAAAWSE